MSCQTPPSIQWLGKLVLRQEALAPMVETGMKYLALR